jgi:D-aspartate ligase
MNNPITDTPKIPAVVLDMNIPGLAIARSLGRKKIPVIGVDYVSNTHKIYSRYWQPRLMPEKDYSEHLVGFLLEIAKEFNEKAVLFPGHDNYVLFMSRYRAILEKKFRFLLPAADRLEQLVHKQRFYELAATKGLLIPKTFSLKNENEVKVLSQEIRYPCIIKPVYTNNWFEPHFIEKFGYRKALKILSAEQLFEVYTMLKILNQEILIQEIVPGKEDQLYLVLSYCNKQSEPIAMLTARKRRLFPSEFGAGSFIESVQRIPELETKVKQFLQSVSYRGLSEIEFKWDQEAQNFKVIELNPRYVLWAGLAEHCGIDFAELAYQDLIVPLSSKSYSYRADVKWFNTEIDFSSFLEYRRKGELSFWMWIMSYRPPMTFALFAWDDLGPFLVRIKQLLGIIGKKLKLRGKRMILSKLGTIFAHKA